MERTTFLLLICIVAGTYSDQLRCYDCEPDDDRNCVTTETVKTTLCEEDSDTVIHGTPSSYVQNEIQNIDRLDIEGRSNLSEISFECFSLYYESPGSDDIKSGVYRGCFAKNSNIASSCDYLRERFSKGNITKCISCSSDTCNTEYVGGAAGLSISLGVVIANLIICLNIFKF